MDILILFLLIIINGLFSMSEIALVSARKSRLESLAERGDKKAASALDLSNNPELFLSAVQIGITLIAIFTGVYSGERFGSKIEPYIKEISVLAEYAHTISTTLIVIIVTYLSIVFGELIPKRIGLISSEAIARLMAGPMRVFASVTHPFVWLLTWTTNMFFKVFGLKSKRENNVTEEEIRAIISEGTESGSVEQEEKQMIERIFHLGDRNITSLMTHRSDIIWFDINETEQQIREKIYKEPHSVYPICDGEIDNIKGMVSIKDMYVTPDDIRFKDLMRPALFVPENNSAYQVMEKFKETQNHSCFIVDEYGSLLGMITLNDILEAIVGDIPQTGNEDYAVTDRGDGTYLIDAQIPFYDFLTYFKRTEWLNDDEHEFDTLAGCILHELEHIPVTGEKLLWKDFNLEVVDMDGHRIDKVLVTPGEETLAELNDDQES